MSKLKNNRPLILSIVSIMLSTALLIGATMAWFTDTETNKGNTITAGELGITAVWYDVDDDSSDYTAYKIYEKYTETSGDPVYTFNFESGTDDAHDFGTEGPMISDANWQSGGLNAKLIKITNDGTLPVNISLNAVVEDAGLEEALWYDFITFTSEGVQAGNLTVRAMYTLEEFVSYVDVELAVNDTLTFVLVYGMLDSAGNTYQEESYSADITVTATQTNATDTVVYASSVAEINAASANQTVILLADIEGDVTLSDYVNIDFNGYTITGNVTYTIEGTVPGTIDIGTYGEAGGVTGTLTVTAPYGTVNHYGTYGTIDIVEVASHSYNLYATPADGSSAVSIEAGTLNVYVEDTENSTTSITMGGDAVVNDERPATTTDEDGTTTITNAAALSVTTTSTATGTFNDARESGTTTDSDTVTASTPSVSVASGASISVNNSAATEDSVDVSGDGDVTYYEDGVVQPTAEELFIEALEAAVTGDTVILTDDVTLNSNLYIYGKAINIDMDGYDLTINGALVYDYSEVTTIGYSSSDPDNWISIANGTVASGYSGGSVTLSKDQTGLLTISAMYVYVGSGNFTLGSAATGNIGYWSYYQDDGDYVLTGKTFSIGGISMYEKYSDFYATASTKGLLAADTITIGTPTT